MALESTEIGPVQYAVVAFRDGKLNGEVASALADVVKSGAIRIIDLAFVQSDPDGTPRYLELDTVPAEFAAALDRLDGEVHGLLSEDDLKDLAMSLPPGSAGLFVVWEALWAKRLVAAVREAGGELAALDLIPHDVVVTAVDALG
ncbi:DUF6325 family protein [Catenulispora pinisilvae]|uniref:DUF6325 family protein n=1 Tax=Catenulispora pinisilvae TaxID=2705253 RepID=UPI0018918767|nr:DUF6325 family protein [Catenulispora pinisilvae]